jgi:hypothetical protein
MPSPLFTRASEMVQNLPFVKRVGHFHFRNLSAYQPIPRPAKNPKWLHDIRRWLRELRGQI